MRVIILAAGQGTRLKPLTNNLPKCLLRLGNKPVLAHQIETLKSVGLFKISLVLGYLAEKIKQFLGGNYNYILNKNYQKTNSLYSLWLARNLLNDELIIMDSDVLFDKALVKKLISHPAKICIALNTNWKREQGYYVATKDNLVINMGVNLNQNVKGECAGLVKIKKSQVQKLKVVLNDLIRQNKSHLWFEDALVEMIKRGVKIKYLDVKDYFWYEFDTKKEWEYAKRLYKKWKSLNK